MWTKRLWLVLAIGAILIVPAVLISQAADFGPVGQFLAVATVILIASLADLEGLWGVERARRHRHGHR